MTARAPQDPAGWATTGVDLETRRLRVLAGLARLGRTAEQQRFQAQYQALLAVADALADGYVQARFQHVRIALSMPGWSERWEALYRRRNLRAFGPTTSLPVHTGFHQTYGTAADDGNPVVDDGEAERFWTER
jgi:hypothetical protein